MLRGHPVRCVLLLTAALALGSGIPGAPQAIQPPGSNPPPGGVRPAEETIPPPAGPWPAGAARLRSVPGLEPVARIALLMQAINWPNFQGLERRLRQQPRDTAAWDLVRDHALLIAENGNLLMLRWPRRGDEAIWLDRARDLRVAATRLARAATGQDYAGSRAGLIELARTCNNCHRSFQVNVQISAFGGGAAAGVPAPPAVPAAPAPPRPPTPPAPPAPPAPPGGL